VPATAHDHEVVARDSASVLDMALLGRLLEFLGQDLKSIYVSYFNECATALDSLDVESDKGSLFRAGRIAHQMLGASSTLGMLGLAASFAAVGESVANQQLPRSEWIKETRALLALSIKTLNEVDFDSLVGES
jgi:hypothetical protein